MALINVISPHIDDAVFSLGAYLQQFRQYGELQIINVFSLSTLVYGKKMPIHEATQIRKAEDDFAVRMLGIDSICNLDFPEALLRGYTIDNLRSELDDDLVADRDLISKLADSLARVIEPSSIVLSPVAFGSNVDHVNVRLACGQLDTVLVYYADLPYAADSVRYNHQSGAAFIRGMNSQMVYSGHNAIERHFHLCRHYRSQFQERFVPSVRNYLYQNGFRMWSHHEFSTLNLDIK
ncbi:MAG: PIG-L family deacetylase [Anaerolineae bacterium]|nr:PIG-L family deacetylase [Anaerolineae bacterium]